MSAVDGKRRARAGGTPTAAAALLGLDDLGESSDDSDFRIEDHPEESDDYSIDSDDNGRDDAENGEDDSDDSEEPSIMTKLSGNDKSDIKNSHNMSVNELLQIAKLNDFKNVAPELTSMLICAGCLGSRSDDSNEIVECDGCGVTVHEGCYGVSDVTSESSTASSASTEPWFCDACKAGVINPNCELCPNSGGIFKETEVGAWVHLVCALYVPGVAFSEVDKLSGVTLFEMAYSRWGARACCLCEDERFSRTGICIGCDAGLCRTYFHVTCGQREGLLAEAHTEEVEQADPFYAHCKLHSDKTLIKKQKRNWLALQLRTAQRRLDLENNTDNATQMRTIRKLEKYRKRFIAMKELKNAPWVPTQKMPRLLPTSATACRKLMHKAKMMGIDTVALEMQDSQLAALTDVRKKWHIPPAFSVEFIGYYLERNNRMDTMKHCLEKLVDANSELLAQQKELNDEYDAVSKESTEASQDLSNIKQNVTKIYECMLAICPTKTLPNVDLIGVNLLPLQPVTGPRRTMSVPTAAALKMGVGFPLNTNPEEHVGKVLSTSKEASNNDTVISLNNECGICSLKTDQHLLAKCDTCHLHYHITCLKPPLTRLPKKSKLYGWQCSECDKSSESEADVLEPKVARRSRTRYSKDGSIIPVASTSPVHTPETKIDPKPLKLSVKSTIDIGSCPLLKVTIKPLEPPPPPPPLKDPLDVFSMLDEDLEDPQINLSSRAEKLAAKRERKARKIKKQGYITSSTGEIISTKKSRKRSFTSPALTNTPLMSITPLVVESPHDSPSQMDCSNTSAMNNITAPPNQITNDTSFLSPNSTFSTLLAGNPTSTDETLIITNQDEPHYKSNRKKRKEKHCSRYSPDMMKSSKGHKHKRKKRSLSIEENPDIPHPRITIKIKPIPKPAGSVDPQLFYVPTDSNDGPPVDLMKQAAKHHHVEEEVAPAFESPPLPPPVKDDTPKVGSSTRKKKWESRSSIEPLVQQSPTISRRSATTNSYLSTSSASTELRECDVCSQAGTHMNLVRCDECARVYHFTCLEPPLLKNPKKRGYSWHCADCDPETDPS